MPIYKITSSLICQWFFPRKRYQYAFIVKECKKHTFLNEISSKNLNFLNGPRFNSCISISYTKKIHQRIPLATLVLKYIRKFFKLCDRYYFVTNILHIFKFFIICWISKIFFNIMFKFNRIYKNPRCDVHTLQK